MMRVGKRSEELGETKNFPESAGSIESDETPLEWDSADIAFLRTLENVFHYPNEAEYKQVQKINEGISSSIGPKWQNN